MPPPNSPSLPRQSPAICISTYQGDEKTPPNPPSFTHQAKPTGTDTPWIGPTDLFWKYPGLRYLKFTYSKQVGSTVYHNPKTRFATPHPFLPGDDESSEHEISTDRRVAFPESTQVANPLASAVHGAQFSGKLHLPLPHTQCPGTNGNSTPMIASRGSSATWSVNRVFGEESAKSLRLVLRPRQRPLDQSEEPQCSCQPGADRDITGQENWGQDRELGAGLSQYEVQCERAKGSYPIHQFRPFKQPTLAEFSKSRVAALRVQSSFQNRCELWRVLVDKEQ